MMNSRTEVFDQIPAQKGYNLISSLPQNTVEKMPSRKKVIINLRCNLNLSLAQIQTFKRD